VEAAIPPGAEPAGAAVGCCTVARLERRHRPGGAHGSRDRKPVAWNDLAVRKSLALLG